MDKKIYSYIENINPSEKLIERTVNMVQNNKKKTVKFSKRAIALLAAAIVLVIGITGYAAVNHIFGNNEKGIVNETENEGVQFMLDYTKADTSPDVYSNKDNEIVKKFINAGYKEVLLPDALIGPNFTVSNIKYEKGKLSAVNFDDGQGDIFTVFMIPGLAREEMKNAVALSGNEGVEINECYVEKYNGIDVQLTYFGSDEFGYSSRITYAVGDTLYIVAPPSRESLFSAKNMTEELAKTLETQH